MFTGITPEGISFWKRLGAAELTCSNSYLFSNQLLKRLYGLAVIFAALQ